MGDELGVDLIGGHEAHALGELGFLAHGRPDVRVDRIGAADGVHGIVGDADGRAGFGGELLGELHDLGVGLEFGGCGVDVVHAEDGGGDHEGVLDVVAPLSAVGERKALELAEVLLHGHEVGEHLGGVLAVGEPVPHGYSGVLSELLDVLLLEAAELDAVEHGAQDLGGVEDGLLLAELDVSLAQVLGVGAQVDAGGGEGGAGAGGGLLEEKCDVLALKVAMRDITLLEVLEVLGEADEPHQLVLGVVPGGEKMATLENRIRHDCDPFRRISPFPRRTPYGPSRQVRLFVCPHGAVLPVFGHQVVGAPKP